MNDVAEAIALGVYGRTSRVNSPQNQSEDFQAGFKVGCGLSGSERIDAIQDEWKRRGCPHGGPAFERFREWKRGMWAAVFQTITKL